MKTILVPVDLVKIDNNAIEYAFDFALHTNAKLILFNVFQLPLVTTEIPILLPLSELENDCMVALKKIEKKLLAKHNTKLIVECACKCGFPGEEINVFAKQKKVDLIIMGVEKEGIVAEKIIGSTTTSLINITKTPVLVVKKRMKFKGIKKIVLACDYTKPLHKNIFETLKEYALLFDSHIYVINIYKEDEPDADKKMIDSLAQINHSYYNLKNEDIIDGINEFVLDNAIDLIVTVPRIHSLIGRFFKETNTKRMAFHSKAPLLTLHE